MSNDNENLSIIKTFHITKTVSLWSVRCFFAVLFAGMIISFIIPLRPTYSDYEKRDLESFPRFTFASLFNGEYFDGISTWFSDTFPFRDIFIGINSAFGNLYGKSDVVIHGQVEQADEIPDVISSASSSSAKSSTDSGSLNDTSSAVSSQAEVSSSQPQEPPAQSPQPVTQTLGALLINGDTAYEYYNFVQQTANSYVDAVNRAALLTAGKANVYDIIVPTSMGITAPDELVATVNTSDQKKAIDYMYSVMNPEVRKVPIFDTLKKHKDEYIYFRTDHHWTALGAYYAYSDLMTAMGSQAIPLDQYICYQFPGYLGSFYGISGKLPQLAANPDTVFAYQPPQTNVAHIQTQKGNWYDGSVISDKTNSGPSAKYLSFINGDNPFTIINNPTAASPNSTIVIKESFGNCFVPFLVPHYQTVYVVDYRYFLNVDPRGLAQLREETGASDIIFINNISATRNKSLVDSINTFVR